MSLYPHEKFIYKDEVYSLPCDAWALPGEEVEGEKSIRYLLASLTCGECDKRGVEICEFFIDDTTDPQDYPEKDHAACMAFVPR